MDTPGSHVPSVLRRHVTLAAQDNFPSGYVSSSFTNRLDAVSDGKCAVGLNGVSSISPANAPTLSRLSAGDSRAFIQRAEGVIETARSMRHAAEVAAAARAARDDTLAGLIRVAFDGAPMPEQASMPSSVVSAVAAPRYLTALELVQAMAEAEAVASASAAGSPLPGWPLAGAAAGRLSQATDRPAHAGQHSLASLPSAASVSLPGSASSASSRPEAARADAAAAAIAYEAAAAATSSPHIRHLSSFARHGLGLGIPASARGGGEGASPASGAAAGTSSGAVAGALLQRDSSAQTDGAGVAAAHRHLAQAQAQGALLPAAPAPAVLTPTAHAAYSHSYQNYDAAGELHSSAARSEPALRSAMSSPSLLSPAPSSPSRLRLAALPAAQSASFASTAASSLAASALRLGDGLGLRMHMSLADMTASVDGLAQAHVTRSAAQAHAHAHAAGTGAGGALYDGFEAAAAAHAVASPLHTQLHAAPPRRCICGAAASGDGEAAQTPIATASPRAAASSIASSSTAHGRLDSAPASYSSPLAHPRAGACAGAGVGFSVGGAAAGSGSQTLPFSTLRTASPAAPIRGSPLHSSSPASQHYASRLLSSHAAAAALSPSERDIRRVHAHIDESLTEVLRQLHSR